MVMTRNPTREWNIKRPVKAYIHILPMWVDRKNILSKINNAPKTPLLIIYRAKLLKHDWLMWRESFRETITRSWLVETQRCESCYQEQKYKNKRYITRVKTHKLLRVCKQVVTSLFTSCQQVVFALLQQVWNKLLTTCNKLDDIIRLVTRLF